jgi:hypothetical protein
VSQQDLPSCLRGLEEAVDPAETQLSERANKTMSGSKDYQHDMTMMLVFHDALRLDHIARVAAASSTCSPSPSAPYTVTSGWALTVK